MTTYVGAALLTVGLFVWVCNAIAHFFMVQDADSTLGGFFLGLVPVGMALLVFFNGR